MPRRAVTVHLCIDDDELGEAAVAARTAITAMRIRVDDRPETADLLVMVFGDRYGPIDPAHGMSRLEMHYLSAGDRPRLVYVLPGTGRRDQHLSLLLSRVQADDLTSYRRVSGPEELAALVADDLALALTEAFTRDGPTPDGTSAEPRPRPAPRARIPAPWHRLVGREREVTEVVELLHSVRLLTITGPGGIGKSRLAIEVATRSRDRFADGEWFVDLSGLRDPALVAPTIAHALGVRESAGALPVLSLKSYLSTMHALVLLDSFEMVTSAAPLLVDLLGSAPGVSLLVTSRSVLRVRGEQEYPLSPLSVPPPGSDGSEESAALELFLERARTANPTRVLSPPERCAAAEICRRLDGVPLSLELAAARTRLLSPSALLSRLGQALDVLGSGPLDLPERQRALRTTLDWDHALLTADEQVVLRRLSVFARQFSLEAAESVVAQPGLDVFEGLDGLIGKSLVRSHEADLPGEPGFVMLQTVREYAQEHLEAAGEASATHARHAAYVLTRAESAAAAGPSEQEGWFALLEAEHDDIRLALDWVDRTRDVELLLRFAAALGEFWRSHCHFSESRRWLDRALALSSGRRDELRAVLLNSAALLNRARGDYDVADAQYRDALSILQELGSAAGVADTLRFIGNVAYERGDLEGAESWWGRSLTVLEDAPDDELRMSVLNNLGVLAHYRGDHQEALRRYDETFEIAHRLGSRELLTRARMNGAISRVALGEMDTARTEAAAAVAAYADLEDTWDLVDALEVLAAAVGRSGEPAAAGWLFGGAEGLRGALDVRRPQPEQGGYEDDVAASRANGPEAFDDAYAEGLKASVPQIVSYAAGVGGAA